MAKPEITAADKELAKKAIEFTIEHLAEKGAKEELSDYEHNISVVAKQDSITFKLAGLAASIIPFYLRCMERAAELDARAKAAAESQYFGEPGKRMDCYVKLLGVFAIDGYYGTTYITKLITKDGNIATWFASNDMSANETHLAKDGYLSKDEFRRISTGIKKHEVYRNSKQTILTRVTVLTDEGQKQAEEREARKIAREAKKAAKAAKEAGAASAHPNSYESTGLPTGKPNQ